MRTSNVYSGYVSVLYHVCTWKVLFRLLVVLFTCINLLDAVGRVCIVINGRLHRL